MEKGLHLEEERKKQVQSGLCEKLTLLAPEPKFGNLLQKDLGETPVQLGSFYKKDCVTKGWEADRL